MHSKNSKCEGILALKKLCHLKKFLFAISGQEFGNLELKYVSVCLTQMPKLKTVGRDIKAFAAEEFKLADNVPSHYHDFLGLECPVKTFSGRVPLRLRELFTTASYLQKTGHIKKLLPNLKRLHIKHDTKDVLVPDTVTEIGLYCNRNPEQLKALSPRLRALTLHRCDLTRLKTGSIMKLCPNLEELTVHKCSADPSNIVCRRDIKRSRLRKLTLSSRLNSCTEGMLSQLLQAPQLERVHITGYSTEAGELQRLIRQVSTGRILQNVTYCLMRGDCYKELLMNVRAFCPKVEFVSS
jgi:hypothetical protein